MQKPAVRHNESGIGKAKGWAAMAAFRSARFVEENGILQWWREPKVSVERMRHTAAEQLSVPAWEQPLEWHRRWNQTSNIVRSRGVY